MSQLPSGTVTFLFTDIEGSTRKWQNWPHNMKGALKKHDDILQQTIEENNGYVFKTVGDAFCAAFQTALDCIKCALSAQQKINEESWDLPEAFRVRMAIHTGEAVERNKDYYGPVLNRVARLEGITYGGQVLLSLVTAELVRDMLPEPMGLSSLGKHRLKDLTRPEEVFQLIHPDLPEDFEPLNSLDSHRHNLSIQPSPLIGRDEELKQIRHYLLESSSRIVTITGPGGMGKTRIAVQAGAEMIDSFNGGVFFIDLTKIKNKESFFRLICTTLSIDESGKEDLFDKLVNYLSGKECLLILDNYEHVMDAAVNASELLSHCSDLYFLVTSREALHLRGEQVFHLPPLSMPTDLNENRVKKLNQFDSVRLFIERALEVNSEFEVTNINAPYIAQICSELDGIPLAIELAAARITTLSPRALLKRLNHRLDILTFGASDLPDRHRTIRSTIGWSFELLEEEAKNLFVSLSIFQGGFDLDAIEAVCPVRGGSSLDELEHLVEKNLVVRKALPNGESWFYLLETIHEFASDMFESSSLYESIRTNYIKYFFELSKSIEEGIHSPAQKNWIDRITGHHANMCNALSMHSLYLTQSQLGYMVSAMRSYWEISGPYSEGISIYRKILKINYDVRVIIGLAALLIKTMEFGEAINNLIGLGNKELSERDLVLKHYYLGWARFRINDLEKAEIDFNHAGKVAERNHLKLLEGKVLHGKATVLWKMGRLDESRNLFSDSLTIMKYFGEPRSIAHIANSLGIIYSIKNELEKAEKYFSDALPIFRSIGGPVEIKSVLNNLGYLNSVLAKHRASANFYKELLKVSRDDQYFLGTANIGLSIASLGEGKIEQAFRFCKEALKIFNFDNYPGDYGIALRVSGDIRQARKEYDKAYSLYKEAIPLLKDNHEDEDLVLAEREMERLSNISFE